MWWWRRRGGFWSAPTTCATPPAPRSWCSRRPLKSGDWFSGRLQSKEHKEHKVDTKVTKRRLKGARSQGSLSFLIIFVTFVSSWLIFELRFRGTGTEGADGEEAEEGSAAEVSGDRRRHGAAGRYLWPDVRKGGWGGAAPGAAEGEAERGGTSGRRGHGARLRGDHRAGHQRVWGHREVRQEGGPGGPEPQHGLDAHPRAGGHHSPG